MFSISLTHDASCDHSVIVLRGELDFADAAGAAGQMRSAAAPGHLATVDMTGLEFIDSSGVAALALVRKQARDSGGDLLLAGPQGQVLRFLTHHQAQ